MASAELPVRVITSARRTKTVAARIVDGVIEVRVPARLDPASRDQAVSSLVAKLERRRAAGRIDLPARARELANRHDLPVPTRISWSNRQHHRWGSCSTTDSTIRISERLAELPLWVLDYVIVHELAHLVEPDHGSAFQALVSRYPRSERASGFLEAVSLGHAGG